MIDALFVGLIVLLIRKAWPGLRQPRILILLALALGVGQALARGKTVREGLLAGLAAAGLYDAGQTFIGGAIKALFGPKGIASQFWPLPCLGK